MVGNELRRGLQKYFILAACVWGSGRALGQMVMREDLSAVKLPHGELVLPLRPAQAVVLHLSDGKLAAPPALGVGKTGRDLLAAMRDGNTGDLWYLEANTLLVVSGTASDLGEHYLSDFNDPPPPAPKEMPADAAHPHSLPGVFHAVHEGHVFSVVTTDGKYAIVRVLRCQADGALVQYVYQPDGTLQFDVPKSQVFPLPALPVVAEAEAVVTAPAGGAPAVATGAVPATAVPVAAAPGGPAAAGAALAAPNPSAVAVASPGAPAVAAAYAPIPAAAMPQLSPPRDNVLMPYFNNFMEQRTKLIAQRIETVKAPARTEAEIAGKVMAIEELGELGAAEATDTLVDQIAFFNSLTHSRQFSVEICHPAVVALRKIGKPASIAALKAIGQLPLQPPAANEDPLRTPSYKLWLLTMVIQGVEGEETAEYILTRAALRAEPDRRPIYEQAVKYLREP